MNARAQHSIVNRFKRDLSWYYRRLADRHKHTDREVPKEEIFRFLPASAIVIEAGAFNGADTEEMSRLWPKATIHAIEPLPHAYEQLVLRAGFRKNVHSYCLALSDKSGVTTMYVSEGDASGGDQSSSILSPKEVLERLPKIRFDRQIKVPVHSVPDFMVQQGIGQVDLLWLDLQGAEFSVLCAAAPVLPQVSAIYMEVYQIEAYEGVTLYPEVREWLSIHGFRVEREGRFWAMSGNVLFVNERKFSLQGNSMS